MLPREHAVYGLIFVLVIGLVFPNIGLLNLFLIFFGSFFIDFDHYLIAVDKNRSLSLKKSYKYYDKLRVMWIAQERRGIKKKMPLMIFHTIEFHIIAALLGFFVWDGFLFVLLGMILHSILDIINMHGEKALYRREFLLFSWIAKKNF